MDEDQLNKMKEIVDVKFSENILRKLVNDASIKVTDVAIKPATSKGDNYTSDMFRVTAEFVRCNGDTKDKEKKTFIVKVEPLAEGERKQLITNSSLFSTEIMMMTDTLAKMNEALGPGYSLNGRGLFTQKGEPTLLVIEDLAPLRFRMADRQAGLDMDHCLLAVRGLARFHASSVALCEKEPDQKERYTSGMFNEQWPLELRAFFIEGTRQLGREVVNWPELDSKYSGKILKLADSIYQKGIETSVCRPDEFNVINHGDFWVNNMLFKYNDAGRPIGHIFVDFQLCNYTSPACDLQYFFNTSLNDDTLTQNQEALMQEYLNTLTETMTRTNCKTKAPTMDQLKKMMRDRAMYGLIASCSILPVLLVDKGEAKDLGEIMNNGEFDNPAYRNPLYRKAMVNRLPKFDRMGLLD